MLRRCRWLAGAELDRRKPARTWGALAEGSFRPGRLSRGVRKLLKPAPAAAPPVQPPEPVPRRRVRRVRLGRRRRAASAEAARPEADSGEQAEYQAAMSHAVAMLQNMPVRFAAESSVVRDALKPPPKALPEPEEPSPDDGAMVEAESGAVVLPAHESLSRLQDALEHIENLARKHRERAGQTEPRAASSQAYLDLLVASPSAIEAAVWFDELESLRPEWVAPEHFEVVLNRMTAYFPGPAPERDILLVWLKARARGMATPAVYSRLFRRLGLSTLREVAFPLLWAAARQDLGTREMPEEVITSVLRNCAYRGDVQTGVDAWLQLTRESAPIARHPSVLLELLALLTSKGIRDQDVTDYIFAEMQAGVGQLIEQGGPAAVPSSFFSNALRVADADSAARLWYFMVKHGVTVSYREYRSLMQAFVNERRADEAEELYNYLALNYPEMLSMRRGAIVRQMMRLYAMLKDYGSSADLFATHFDGGGLEPSKAEYYMMLQALKRGQEQTAYTLWREMLSKGLKLDTQSYMVVFEAMGGRIGPLSHQVPYSLPASPLDDEIPRQLVEMGEGVEHELQTEPKLPPASQGSWDDVWNPYAPLPIHGVQQQPGRLKPVSGPLWGGQRGDKRFLGHERSPDVLSQFVPESMSTSPKNVRTLAMSTKMAIRKRQRGG